MQSYLWRQILASTLETELVTVNTNESGAYGAAILAGVGVKNWKKVESACKECVKITGRTKPNLAQVEIYKKSYAIYQELYPILQDSFEKLTSM